MRAASTNLANHLNVDATTLCRLWRVTRKDGTELFFTDHVRDVTYDGDVYRSDISFTCSAIFTSSSLQRAQSVTVVVIMDDAGIKEADLRARKYDGAIGEVMLINYAAPLDGVMQLYKGQFGQIKITDKRRATIEIRPLGTSGRAVGGMDAYQQTCRRSLGDLKCGVDLEAIAIDITVDAYSQGIITADEIGAFDDDYFALGQIRWVTGNNAGTVSMVGISRKVAETFTLVSLPLSAIQPGDTGRLYPGCDKIITTCRDKFDNVKNFRGEPFVPTQDTITLHIDYPGD